jgi:hypothetical protein
MDCDGDAYPNGVEHIGVARFMWNPVGVRDNVTYENPGCAADGDPGLWC